ncbi:MAG: polysaccharide deacetylase family protein [Bacteroidales bacterium]|nr:polysaccharide deacetylase family protein [Bacteroidales bacterium]
MKLAFVFTAGIALLSSLSACKPTQVEYEVNVTPYKDNKACAISFTYDDGMLCHYSDIAPELEKRGFRGTFWIIGANMDKLEPDYPWMTWEQVADLANRGHEMSNHTWTHPALTSLSAEEVKRELWLCDSVLEARTGIRPITMAYPYNAMSPEVVALCEEGRVGTRTFQEGHGQANSFSSPESMENWLQEQISNHSWGVTMTHGTTYGWDLWNDPQQLYDFYDVVKNAEDSVWVGTFAEVASYLKEREAVQISANGTTNACQITCTNPLDTLLYHEPLTLRLSGHHWQGKQVRAQQGATTRKVINADSCLFVEFAPCNTPLSLAW